MCFIGPIFTINTHIIAVREGDWALHLAMEEEMHYLHSMEVMPQDVRIEFAAGNHTMHDKRGQLDSIWSDMTIEVTFVRFGHSKGGGIIGITTKSETLKVWMYSISAWNKIQ